MVEEGPQENGVNRIEESVFVLVNNVIVIQDMFQSLSVTLC